jgi:hypothetical protein
MSIYTCFEVYPPNHRHCPSSLYINNLLTISYLPYLSFVLNSFSVTKWFLENGADPNLGPDTYPPYAEDSAMVPNSGHVLERAACTNPATAISVINLLLHQGVRLEGSIPLHCVSQCRSPQLHEQHKNPNANSHLQVQNGLHLDPPYAPSSSGYLSLSTSLTLASILTLPISHVLVRVHQARLYTAQYARAQWRMPASY